MSAIDEIRAELSPRNEAATCTVTLLRRRLTGDDLEGFDQAIADPDITASAIARWLGKKGVVVRVGPIERHRRGGCQCPR